MNLESSSYLPVLTLFDPLMDERKKPPPPVWRVNVVAGCGGVGAGLRDGRNAVLSFGKAPSEMAIFSLLSSYWDSQSDESSKSAKSIFSLGSCGVGTIFTDFDLLRLWELNSGAWVSMVVKVAVDVATEEESRRCWWVCGLMVANCSLMKCCMARLCLAMFCCMELVACSNRWSWEVCRSWTRFDGELADAGVSLCLQMTVGGVNFGRQQYAMMHWEVRLKM